MNPQPPDDVRPSPHPPNMNPVRGPEAAPGQKPQGQKGTLAPGQNPLKPGIQYLPGDLANPDSKYPVNPQPPKEPLPQVPGVPKVPPQLWNGQKPEFPSQNPHVTVPAVPAAAPQAAPVIPKGPAPGIQPLGSLYLGGGKLMLSNGQIVNWP